MSMSPQETLELIEKMELAFKWLGVYRGLFVK